MQSGGPPASSAAASGSSASAPPSQAVGGVPNKPAGNIIRPVQQTSYHVPRGAAAVASIAMPRPSSLATVRSGPAGSLVSIRGSTRAPSPAPQQPHQIRTRPASSPAHSATRPITPQRSDTPRPSLNSGVEKTFTKSTVPLPQGQGRSTPLVGQSRLAAPPALSSAQSVQIVTQTVTLATSQPAATIQTPMQVVTQSVSAGKPRPITQQGVQAGTMTTLPTNPPAVVLAAPARLASPGLIGVQTGPTRLAVATALPASGARIVSPSARVPQGRTVTYTSSHQMLQAARLPPPVPVRVNAGRVLHPVLGVAPLKPAPAPVSSAAASATSAPTTQAPASALVTAQAGAGGPGQQATALPTLRALPAQSKVMASAVVTVAAVAGTPLRSVVAAVPAGATPTTLATVSTISSAAASAGAGSVSKPGVTFPQTLTTVAARPVAVAGQAVRPAPGQPSVFIQTTGPRASPGPAGERTGTFPIQSAAYFYEAPPGSFQVANVSGRTYTTGGPPYIVQATTARPVGAAAQGIVSAPTAAGTTAVASGTTTTLPVVASVVASVASSAATASAASNAASTAAAAQAQPGQPQPQPPRFNSIMVLDPSRTALPLPIHAVVPAEGGATGTTYIAADGSLVPVQALPVTPSGTPAASQAGAPQTQQAAAQESVQSVALSQPAQIVTQVASVVSQAVTSSAAGHLPVQIQMVPAPVHIQMHPAHQAVTTSHAPAHTTAAPVAVPMSVPLAVTHQVHQVHQVLAHAHPVAISSQGHLPQSQPHSLHPPAHGQAQGAGPTPTTPIKPNASPRPSILRKRDNEGSPMKAQKNLTPLLQSMSSSAASLASAAAAAANPPSPPSPPKRPDSSGPQSSGSTTISATSSPGQESPPQGGSQQPPPSAASITAGLHAAGLGTEMSPRKKPRKQQLTGNELQEHKMSDEEMEFLAEDNGDDFPLNHQPQEPQQLHQQVLQQQQEQQQQQAALPPPPPAPREFTLKRPNISLLSSYRYSWKSRNNHFLRHSDVRPKDERRPSVNELASQRHIYQRLNGWKVHHLTAQMEDLADVESEVCQQLEAMLGLMERKNEQDEDKDVTRVSELIKGNMQRSRVIADQLLEAKATVMKIFDHKPHVNDIIHRSSGKRERIFKKREKS
ncbi:hypothetical protein ONE63_005909 [Megalurothrips usitatus]|uniref:Histone deacetylase complex subunit SAP130 C-terminal domain-containing protein n=1 Tax=Megalurothrips usitatus TaxID=439358 RepID=A0AAV7Y0X1_9NEOP|nr:hypothetical protein ONE63_005909 [Megalurothrips usitatus]